MMLTDHTSSCMEVECSVGGTGLVFRGCLGVLDRAKVRTTPPAPLSTYMWAIHG